MGENSGAALAALLKMPRRDNSAYLEALRLVRETFAQAEAEFGRAILSAECSRNDAGSFVITTTITSA